MRMRCIRHNPASWFDLSGDCAAKHEKFARLRNKISLNLPAVADLFAKLKKQPVQIVNSDVFDTLFGCVRSHGSTP